MTGRSGVRIARIAALLVLALSGGAGWADRLLIDCPKSLRSGLTGWIEHRSEQGHSIEMIDVDRLATNRSQPNGERTVLVLVGDGSKAGRPPRFAPARVVQRFGPESLLATDHPLADSVGADAVARLPFRTPAELSDYLNRVIEREQQPAGWGDLRLRVSAGVGGFSPVIDAAIEGAAKRLIRDLAPPSREITLRRVAEGTPSALDRGGVWVWLGHGMRHRLPGIEPSELVCHAGGADIAVLLACYAGDFTGRGDCVAQQLLNSPDGPIAVIASTRVSMPYGNARLGAELLSVLGARAEVGLGRLLAESRAASLRETNDPRLKGLDSLAALLGGESSSLPSERQDHTLMYHLLGDPCCIVDRCVPLALEEGGLAAGREPFTVRGVAPFAGSLRAEWIKGNRSEFVAAPRFRAVTDGESFGITMTPPKTWRRGSRTLRVGVQGADGLAVGTLEVRRGLSSPAKLAVRRSARTDAMVR